VYRTGARKWSQLAGGERGAPNAWRARASASRLATHARTRA
jgi:hypothetical protein